MVYIVYHDIAKKILGYKIFLSPSTIFMSNLVFVVRFSSCFAFNFSLKNEYKYSLFL